MEWSMPQLMKARNFAARWARLVFMGVGLAVPGDFIWPNASADAAADSAPGNSGRVRLEGNSLRDDSGPFLGLGASYFQALRRAKFDRTRLTNDLAFLASKKFNYVRVLSMVGWHEAWEGREIAPVTFRNRAGKTVEAWPDYWQQFRDLIDLAYSHGLRVQVTIFADAQLMPDKAARIHHLTTMLEQLSGRAHKIVLLEVANEAWQNGFPGTQGVADLREFTKILDERTTIPVAITSNHETGDAELVALHKDSGADVATFHFSRDTRTVEGGWLPVRDCYRVGNLPGLPPFSSNEPIGPGSSVASENDPIKLVMAAAFAWTANLPMYVYHTSAGVFGHQEFQVMSGVGDFIHLHKILPPDLPNWRRNDGRETNSPFTVFANGQADKWWPDVPNPTNGVVRNTGAIKGNEFVALPIGILEGGVTLRARRPMEFSVYHPLTGAVVTNVAFKADGEVWLPRGPGAYIIRGSFRDAETQMRLKPRDAQLRSQRGRLGTGRIRESKAGGNVSANLGALFHFDDRVRHPMRQISNFIPAVRPLRWPLCIQLRSDSVR